MITKLIERFVGDEVHTLRYAVWRRLPISKHQIRLARIQSQRILKLEHDLAYWHDRAKELEQQLLERGGGDA